MGDDLFRRGATWAVISRRQEIRAGTVSGLNMEDHFIGGWKIWTVVSFGWDSMKDVFIWSVGILANDFISDGENTHDDFIIVRGIWAKIYSVVVKYG